MQSNKLPYTNHTKYSVIKEFHCTEGKYYMSLYKSPDQHAVYELVEDNYYIYRGTVTGSQRMHCRAIHDKLKVITR